MNSRSLEDRTLFKIISLVFVWLNAVKWRIAHPTNLS